MLLFCYVLLCFAYWTHRTYRLFTGLVSALGSAGLQILCSKTHHILHGDLQRKSQDLKRSCNTRSPPTTGTYQNLIYGEAYLDTSCLGRTGYGRLDFDKHDLGFIWIPCITQNIPKSKDLGSSWGQAIVSVSGTSDFPTCAGHKCQGYPRLRNFNDKSTRHISASMTSTPRQPRHKDFPLAAAGILVVDGHIRLDPTEGVLPCADRSY